MKRENTALLTRARHSAEARCEVGRRYLTGSDGFPRHEQTALDYLSHPSVRDTAEMARIVCRYLPLERIVSLGYAPLLLRAAGAGCAEAQFKQAVWLEIGWGRSKSALRWLSMAADAGHATAQVVQNSLRDHGKADSSLAFALALTRHADLQVDYIAARSGELASEERDIHRLNHCIRVALACCSEPTVAVARLVKDALTIAIADGIGMDGMYKMRIEQCLDLLVSDGDTEATYLLGRALCGIACGSSAAGDLVQQSNLRKGAAMLLRAADAGCNEAWMHLYRVHADHRCSVANPQLSRFFLEKAASLGEPEAQRRLGALTLRSSNGLKDSEKALRWMHAAACQGDPLAIRLLRTLVLPTTGEEEDARRAIDRIRSVDPWLAARLRLARDFGLTKLEALCVDPISGKRPWGLVVGKNPFITLSRLAAPRAIPALSPAVMENLQRTALLFETGLRDGDMFEGDWRKRSARQRTLFARHGIADGLFFAQAGSVALDVMRKGHKWAVRARSLLDLALAA